MSTYVIPGSWLIAPDSGPQGPAGPQGPQGEPGPQGPAGEGGTPNGLNKQVQYNNNGEFAGNVNFTFDSSTNTLSVDNIQAESIAPPPTLSGTYTISSPTTITLDPASEIVNAAPMQLMRKTVFQLGSITASEGSIAFCTNAPGGSVPVFYDGINWRSFTDRSIVA